MTNSLSLPGIVLVWVLKIMSFSKIHSPGQTKMISSCICDATAKSLQSCPTLCDPRDGSPPGSPVPWILQARTLEWVAISPPMHESEKWKWSRSVMSNSLRPHGLQPTRVLHPWDFPGKSTGVGCHCLLRGRGQRSIKFNYSFGEPNGATDPWGLF